MSTYLGLDLGTSGLRGLIVDHAGVPVGDATADYPVATLHDGWSEQDPALWLDACRAVMSNLKATHPKAYASIGGIGVAGHMHGATLLDDRGEIVRPCILWNDTRSAAEAATLDGDPVFRELSGNIVFPGFTAPKLAWLAIHEPANFARVSTVMLPKDYLVYWLSGRLVSEMSDAAGTGWLDTGKRSWSEDLLTKSGMRRDQMPDLIEGAEAAGTVSAIRADELGLSANVIVAGGGGDNAAAACGVGAFREGDGFVSLGTSGVILAARNNYAPMPGSAVHTFCHAVPDRWYQMGVALSATDSLNWLAGLVGKSPTELAGQLDSTPDQPGPVCFLPYLSGERTPHNDAAIRGAFIGLAKSHDSTALVRAVMEGVCYAMRDCLEALSSSGTSLSRILAIGGGSNSDTWVQMLADVLKLDLNLPAKGDFGAALGGARLAMVAAGAASTNDIMTAPTIDRTIEPRPEAVERYAEGYARYASLYPKLKDLQ